MHTLDIRKRRMHWQLNVDNYGSRSIPAGAQYVNGHQLLLYLLLLLLLYFFIITLAIALAVAFIGSIVIYIIGVGVVCVEINAILIEF